MPSFAQLIFRNLSLAMVLRTGAAAAETPVIPLSQDSVASMPIILSENASTDVQQFADELASYLEKLSGAKFVVETGDGSRGIVVGRPADFPDLPFELVFESGPFHREDYLLRSHATGLYLLGGSDLAVSHAVWDLLSRLGYRQFFPGPTWEVIPEPRDLELAVDASESPDFYSRRIWYNWAPRISGTLLDGSGREAFDFGNADEGWFQVPVPEGEDGKLWKFQSSQGQRLLMTVPPNLARTAEGLLLPSDVVEKDAAR